MKKPREFFVLISCNGQCAESFNWASHGKTYACPEDYKLRAGDEIIRVREIRKRKAKRRKS